MDILLLLVGLGLIVLGADWLVDGATAIARKAGVSEFVIGLTIVGFGTSCPELVVNLTGAMQGNADIAIGNVVGSNIFNILFILGLTAFLMPVSMTEANRRRDIPITLSASLLLICCGMSSTLFGLGVSDKFIAITVLAGGTSFPELATCIVAAARHKDQLALGNILGSNVFNILLILGCSSVITPLSFSGMSLVDAAALIISCLMLLLWAYTGRKCRIDRWEGALMLLAFAAYYYYLFTKL